MVSQPMGFMDEKFSEHVYVCYKDLFVALIKQSPRRWYRRLREFLITLVFKESYDVPSLFI